MQVTRGKKLAEGSSPRELGRLRRKRKEEIVPNVPRREDKVVGKQQSRVPGDGGASCGEIFISASLWAFFCKIQ